MMLALAMLLAPPRIVESTATATLVGSDLVGTATLAVSGRGWLPLEPLNVAITTEATLRRNTGTKLLVDSSKAVFRWSARGREEPSQVRFDLKLPAAAVAALELDLPTPRTPSAADALITGPFPSPLPNHARWRVQFAGRGRVDLVIRTPRTESAARFERTAKYDLSSGHASFDFDVESLRGPVGTLRLRVDADVRITDVPGREWSFDPTTREITVTLAEPLSKGRISILATVTPTVPSWLLAGVHGLGATGAETLDIRSAGDPRIESIDAGDYTLQSDSSYKGAWRGNGATRKPPRLALRASANQVKITPTLIWHLRSERSWLSARVKAEVHQGPVTSFGLKLPPGYKPGTVRFTPEDAAAVVNVSPTQMTIEPSRPWAGGQTVEMVFELRGPPPESSMPIPKLAGDGTLTIDAEGWATPVREFPLPTSETRIELRALAPMPRRTDESPTPDEWRLNRKLTASIDAAGVIHGRVSGTITSVGRTAMPFDLPATAVMDGATQNGRYLDSPAFLPRTGDYEILFHLEKPCGLWRPLPSFDALWESTGPYARLGHMLVHRELLVIVAVALFGTGLVVIVRWLKRRAVVLAGLMVVIPVQAQAPEHVTAWVSRARISGTAVDTHALLTVELIAMSPAESKLSMPLKNLALESATVDGTAVLPLTDGGTVQIPLTPGRHTVTLVGRVPIVPRGSEREVALELEPLPSVTLSLSLSPLARSVRVPQREGALKTARSLSGVAVESDLGSAGPTTVRWRVGGLVNQPARIRTTDVTVFDLNPNESSAITAQRVSITDATVTRLVFDLPANWEPGLPTIRTADGTSVGIRDSRVSVDNGQRTATFVLAEPLEGEALVVWKMVPLSPLTTSPPLSVPKLRDATTASSFIGVKTNAVVDRWARNGTSESTADAVTREIGPVPELALEKATFLVRRDTPDAVLRPTFK